MQELEIVQRFEYNPKICTKEELISLILGGNTLQVAEEVCSVYGETDSQQNIFLGSSDYRDLMTVSGMTKTRAIKLAAAIELGRRVQKGGKKKLVDFSDPERVGRFFMNRLRYEKQEHFLSCYLNVKNRLLGYQEIGLGNMAAAPVDVKAIMQWAIRYKAYGIIIVHNHPSGDPTPSDEDREVTRRIAASAKVLDLELLDHVVMGDGEWVSLHNEGVV